MYKNLIIRDRSLLDINQDILQNINKNIIFWE